MEQKSKEQLFYVLRLIFSVFISLGSVFYLLPTGIAIARKRTNTMAILMLNLLLGWTVIGWIVAIIWATATDVHKKSQ